MSTTAIRGRIAACLSALIPLLIPFAPLRAQDVTADLHGHHSFFGSGPAVGIGDVNGDGFDDVILGLPENSPSRRTAAGSAFAYSGRTGTRLWMVHGAAEHDSLGSSVASAGDVNQDGVPDIIVGAPGADPGGRMEAGSAFVYSGISGEQIWRFDGAEPGNELGVSVSGAGDVNADGFPDVIVGAPGAGPGGNPAGGSALVFSGKDGMRLWKLDGTLPKDDFGFSVSGAGDVNADGFADVIVGAPTSNSPTAGSAFVYSGKDGTKLWQFDGFILTDDFGFSVAGAGDTNADGFADVVVGAPNANIVRLDPWFGPTGSAFVYSGRDGTMLWKVDGAGVLDDLGRSVAGNVDVNRDGIPDVIVGAPGARPRGLATGSALVYSGENGEMIGRIDGGEDQDRLGAHVGLGGDVNQDGFLDVLAVAPGANSVSTHGFKPDVFAYGTGLAGSGGITPQIGFAGSVPEVGSSDFTIRITDTMGGALCAIAGSLVRDEIHVFGGTLYGDFLAPETFLIRLVTTGTTGLAGTGTVSLTLSVPPDPGLVGLSTFWQCFIMDSGSPLPSEISYTRGLAVTVVR